MDTRTARRSVRARCLRIRPLRSSRSHIRPAVEGVTASAVARSTIRCGPREASTTSVRYWAIVVSSAVAPSDMVATPTIVRLAVSTASTAASSTRGSATLDPQFNCIIQLLFYEDITYCHLARPGAPDRPVTATFHSRRLAPPARTAARKVNRNKPAEPAGVPRPDHEMSNRCPGRPGRRPRASPPLTASLHPAGPPG